MFAKDLEREIRKQEEFYHQVQILALITNVMQFSFC